MKVMLVEGSLSYEVVGGDFAADDMAHWADELDKPCLKLVGQSPGHALHVGPRMRPAHDRAAILLGVHRPLKARHHAGGSWFWVSVTFTVCGSS